MQLMEDLWFTVLSLHAPCSPHFLPVFGPIQWHPYSPALFVSALPSAPHMISPSLQTALLMFWWPGPGTLALLLTLTEVLLSPTASRTLRATTLYQPSCCFSHSLFASVSFNPSFVPVLLCSVWNTDGPPPFTFQSQAFPLVHRQQPCREERDESAPRSRDVWAGCVEKCSKFLGNVSICRLNISCIFSITQVCCFITAAMSMCRPFDGEY